MNVDAISQPKRMRISLRAVSASERSKEIGQPLFYTVFLADGLSVASNSENIEGMIRLTSQLGIELSNLSEICGYADRRREVNSLDLGDRKLFATPLTKDEVETRSITKELLEYARLERISALSFTNFSCYSGDFPKDQLRWILETMRDYDAADGPYRLWFEISPEHFPKLLVLRQEIFARQEAAPIFESSTRLPR